ncbi:hypothetical protein BDR07DRAFT_1378664 [Suillus spraguei]|nr:hypothetical protein BDR07DRAFT_1378664 [Suillus spraguei]
MSDAGGSQVSGKSKVLVATFDGTSASYGTKNSNVVKFFSLLKKDTDNQLCYYQAGIGTYFSPGVVSPMFSWLAKILDETFACYLDAHVMEGYKFLMDNYEPGDKICLFGFSRGAYTARALAGMLNRVVVVDNNFKPPSLMSSQVGLLPKSDDQQISFAYNAYNKTGHKQIYLLQDSSRHFRVTSRDTVQSTGVLFSRNLPFAESNTLIKTFRHALSLDEHRVKFLPELYNRPKTDTPDLEFFDEVALSEDSVSNEISSPRNELPQTVTHTSVEAFDIPDMEPIPPSDVMEVWFSGCHCDIGGGNVENSVNVSLAQITLRWMVEQVMLSNCGIVFDEKALERVGMPLSSFPISQTPPSEDSTGKSQPMVDSPGLSAAPIDVVSPFVEAPLPAPSSLPIDPPTTPSLPNPQTCNALAPLFDQMQLKKTWWLLEILPLPIPWQDAYGKWHKKWSFHWEKVALFPTSILNSIHPSRSGWIMHP